MTNLDKVLKSRDITLSTRVHVVKAILKEVEIPDYLTCLLRNLYAGQEATVRTRHGTTDFKIEKGVCQVCILSPCLNWYAEYTMWNSGLDDSQAGSRLPGEISTTSGMPMIPP